MMPLAFNLSDLLVISPEVSAALNAGQPVVALESTIITHGMPAPENVETALAVEQVITEAGALPATIAVIDGSIKVGLSEAELRGIAATTDVLKLSRADLPFAIARQATGSTTVAATMIAASLAGISLFATGGIGGVHQGAAETFDISADLNELANTNVTVVCAGAKAILDLPKTFEQLETLGVPVVGYGCDELPAFWSHHSGIASPLRFDRPEDIAAFMAARAALGYGGGVLVTNPVPAADEIPAAEMSRFIASAIGDAEGLSISGKSLTPYLLNRIFELTDGRSLATNISLMKNNARLAAEIAVEAARNQ